MWLIIIHYQLSLPISVSVGSGNAHTPARAGFVCDAYTPANETADGTKDKDLLSSNMAAPVMSVSDMSDNPKTINRNGVYMYNCMQHVSGKDCKKLLIVGADHTFTQFCHIAAFPIVFICMVLFRYCECLRSVIVAETLECALVE